MTRRVGVALVYHAVGERAGDPAHELVPDVAVASFRRQLAILRRAFRLVTASELLPAVRGGRRGARIPAAVTFDDDLRSHVGVVLPVLDELGVRATFFLNRARRSYWWSDLQAAYDAGALGALPHVDEAALAAARERRPGSIRALARELEGLHRDRLEDVRRALGESPPAGLRDDDVRTLAARGHELGFHTREHPLLTTLDGEELAAALAEGRDGSRAIAYPHGKADARVAAAARAAGYEAGFTGVPCAVTPASDPLLLGRLEPRPDESVPALARRLARLLRA